MEWLQRKRWTKPLGSLFPITQGSCAILFLEQTSSSLIFFTSIILLSWTSSMDLKWHHGSPAGALTNASLNPTLKLSGSTIMLRPSSIGGMPMKWERCLEVASHIHQLISLGDLRRRRDQIESQNSRATYRNSSP